MMPTPPNDFCLPRPTDWCSCVCPAADLLIRKRPRRRSCFRLSLCRSCSWMLEYVFICFTVLSRPIHAHVPASARVGNADHSCFRTAQARRKSQTSQDRPFVAKRCGSECGCWTRCESRRTKGLGTREQGEENPFKGTPHTTHIKKGC
jgi:hypothetical protein